MYSTKFNLENPMEINTLDVSKLSPFPPMIYNTKTITMSKAEYILLQTKDPYTIYCVIDKDNCKLYYLGSEVIANDKVEKRYLIATGDKYNEYILFLNNPTISHFGAIDNLQEICRFDDAQKAIDAMDRYNILAHHSNQSVKLHEILFECTEKILTVNELIIGILSLFGHRENIMLQNVINQCNMWKCDESLENINRFVTMHRCENKYEETFSNYLIELYCKLYDVLDMSNFVRDKRFTNKDFKEYGTVISNIYSVMLT